MEISTLFLGIIAVSGAIIALSFLAIAIVLYKLAKSVDEKVSILTYESASILQSIKGVANGVEQASKIFSIFSFFKKGSKNESK